ncbi:hypothetical protein CLV79_12011 [Limimaricola soesokkakensis]|uniref:Uncharacterized protein n=1 Tax=Limimaricola soesokkakensis TaxID=1343159 RepID=A0A1X7A4U7_9RHOB|nr:hypothetical protein [Limimaricola soesokkakensis]PSK80669.1 hypothetical protein CLV79_12011 [Limimaricola soesokkakensis]SLN70675.1 hypothetical protein LOS8367_03566 [Limimaricola soesokkakensis]
MDINKRPVSPGVFMVLLVAAVLALALVWMLGDVVMNWISGPAEVPAIAAPED